MHHRLLFLEINKRNFTVSISVLHASGFTMLLDFYCKWLLACETVSHAMIACGSVLFHAQLTRALLWPVTDKVQQQRRTDFVILKGE